MASGILSESMATLSWCHSGVPLSGIPAILAMALAVLSDSILIPTSFMKFLSSSVTRLPSGSQPSDSMAYSAISTQLGSSQGSSQPLVPPRS